MTGVPCSPYSLSSPYCELIPQSVLEKSGLGPFIFEVSDIAELRHLLTSAGIAFEHPGWVKKPNELLDEIKRGESILVRTLEKKVVRQVSLAVIKVYACSPEGIRYQLKEVSQEFVDTDGMRSKRERGFDFVAEKLKKGETPLQGAIRGLKEELGLDIAGSDLKEMSTTSKTEQGKTYPLMCQYSESNFEFELPTRVWEAHKGGFQEVEDKAEGRKQITTFKWIPIDTPPLTHLAQKV